MKEEMYKVGLTDLPGFLRYSESRLEQLFFEKGTAVEFYTDFKKRITEAIDNKTFLPVMRMCDGEYAYCVRKKPGKRQKGVQLLKHYTGRLLKRYKTVWGESYTPEQNKLLKKQFPLMLREIAAQGFIANHFLYSEGHFCEEYIVPMQQWFADNGIRLNSDNYTAFYFVYVLLNGPDSLQLFGNRNVLVLSSFNETKCAAVEQELKRRGAGHVFFKAISATQSMLDKPDLSGYVNKVDIVLIAGGIGSANLLLQSRILNAVSIDSGFSLECMANPSRRSERIFCMPDSAF